MCELVASMRMLCCFSWLSASSKGTCSMILMPKCAPTPARSTLGAYGLTQVALSHISWMPAAAALRMMDPMLPGSCTPSMSK